MAQLPRRTPSPVGPAAAATKLATSPRGVQLRSQCCVCLRRISGLVVLPPPPPVLPHRRGAVGVATQRGSGGQQIGLLSSTTVFVAGSLLSCGHVLCQACALVAVTCVIEPVYPPSSASQTMVRGDQVVMPTLDELPLEERRRCRLRSPPPLPGLLRHANTDATPLDVFSVNDRIANRKRKCPLCGLHVFVAQWIVPDSRACDVRSNLVQTVRSSAPRLDERASTNHGGSVTPDAVPRAPKVVRALDRDDADRPFDGEASSMLPSTTDKGRIAESQNTTSARMPPSPASARVLPSSSAARAAPIVTASRDGTETCSTRPPSQQSRATQIDLEVLGTAKPTHGSAILPRVMESAHRGLADGCHGGALAYYLEIRHACFGGGGGGGRREGWTSSSLSSSFPCWISNTSSIARGP